MMEQQLFLMMEKLFLLERFFEFQVAALVVAEKLLHTFWLSMV